MGPLIIDESIGNILKTAQQREAIRKENDINLREAILTAAEKEGLDSLIVTVK